MSVKEWDKLNRPREKMVSRGVEQLSDAELLAILLKNGNKEQNVIEFAHFLLESKGGLSKLMDCSIEELMEFKGIGLAKACEIVCCQEIVKRINYQNLINQDCLNNPSKVVSWLQTQIGLCSQECFIVLLLDNKNRLIKYDFLYKGKNNVISIDPKNVFLSALKSKANAIIVAHNHPSQIVSPSMADNETTKTLLEAGKLIGIPLLDHLIVSFNDYFSYKEHKII